MVFIDMFSLNKIILFTYNLQSFKLIIILKCWIFNIFLIVVKHNIKMDNLVSSYEQQFGQITADVVVKLSLIQKSHGG